MSDAALTHSRVLKIAVPIVISNATVPILGLVDTGVVGQLGQAEPIGAVAIGALILGSIYWVFGFLRMGTTGLVAQAEGQGNRDEVVALLLRGLVIGAGFGLLLIVAQWPLFMGAFRVTPASAEVEEMARGYMAIRIWSAPAAVSIFALTGWLIALERTGQVLVLQVWMNGLNVVLDFAFVLGFNWGVEGVALATFIAEWSGLLLGLWLCRDAFVGAPWMDRTRIFAADKLRRMALVNSDILIRSLLLQSIFISFMFWAADLGDVPLAANQILMQFLTATAFALDGFAFAVETLVGQALGAKNRARLRRAVVLSSIWAGGVSVVMAIGFAVFGTAFVNTMTTAQDVRDLAIALLPLMVISPILGLPSWMLDGIFIGATRTRDMRNMMLISTLAYFAAAVPLVATFGNTGLWLAMLFSFVVRAATLAVKYPALERSADA